MSDGPKLFFNKPKRSKLKQCQPSASKAPSTQSWSAGPVPPLRTPPQLPKESFARRYKFVWPLLLAVNFTVGAYLFIRTKRKDLKDEASATTIDSAPVSTIAATATATVEVSN